MVPYILVAASGELGDTGKPMLFGLVGAGFSVVLLLLTWIESIGVGLVSRRRGLRIHLGRRLVILAHASYGWITLALTVPMGFIAALFASEYSEALANVIAIAGLLAGLLVFETLVYIGMRKMRYANAPGSERELAPDAAPPAG